MSAAGVSAPARRRPIRCRQRWGQTLGVVPATTSHDGPQECMGVPVCRRAGWHPPGRTWQGGAVPRLPRAAARPDRLESCVLEANASRMEDERQHHCGCRCHHGAPGRPCPHRPCFWRKAVRGVACIHARPARLQAPHQKKRPTDRHTEHVTMQDICGTMGGYRSAPATLASTSRLQPIALTLRRVPRLCRAGLLPLWHTGQEAGRNTL